MGADYEHGTAPMVVENIGTLIAAASWVLPTGYTVHAVFSDDADIVDLRMQILSGAWNNTTTKEATLWTPVQSTWNECPYLAKAAAGQVRFRNGGANPIDGIYLIYTVD